MFRKLFLMLLCQTMTLILCAQAVLPALPDGLPWYGVWDGAAPDARSRDSDGNVLLTYRDVSSAGYARYSDFLAEAGYTLTTHLYSGSRVIALLSDGISSLRVEYDMANCELQVALPEKAFLRAWAVDVPRSDFNGRWIEAWSWDGDTMEKQEPASPSDPFDPYNMSLSCDLFLNGEYGYIDWWEIEETSFDGRLLNIRTPYDEYALFFDAAGTLHRYHMGDGSAATLRPQLDPLAMLGTWDVTHAIRGGEVVNSSAYAGMTLVCTPEGVSSMVKGAITSGPHPWLLAWGNDAAFRVDGDLYRLSLDADGMLTMTDQTGDGFCLAPRIDPAECQGDWRHVETLWNGEVWTPDITRDEVIRITAEGMTGYLNSIPAADAEWTLTATWPGGAVMRYSYMQDETLVEFWYVCSFSDDGRTMYQDTARAWDQLATRYIMNRIDDFRPALPDPLTASARGMLSDVTVTAYMYEDGTIANLQIDSAGETAFIANRCYEAAFLSQFIGKTGPFEDADVVTGATHTSQAVINAVNRLFGAEVPEEPVPVLPGNGIPMTASALGYAREINVAAFLRVNGTIAEIYVDVSGESPGFGTRCGEDETFLSQFVGKAGPFEEVDAVAGATITSRAVQKAVNDIVQEHAALFGDVKTGSALGFQSEIRVQLTVNENGAITWLKIDSSGETPGFGTRCSENESFRQQFIGKTAPVEVDLLSGATITSKAVIEAVNAALTAPAAEELTATAKGLLSDVKVTITLNEDGTIATMMVDASGELAVIAGPCTEEAFLSQFIGKAGPFEDVDVVSGATHTSNAVINAVNSLFPAVEADPAAKILTASAKGLLSDVKVTITLNRDGTIATMVVDASGETAGIATPCTEEAFLSNFVGKAGPFEGVEVVSGATFTSNAVINAVNSLFPANQELTATAKGLLSDVKVTITLNNDGTIATMVVDASGETAGIATPCTEEAFLSNFVGKSGPFENVDVVTGATYTSNAVINAVNSLFPAEAP